MNGRRAATFALGAATLALAAGAGGASVARQDAGPLDVRRLARFSPLPAPPADPTNRVADDPRAARLGRYLFFDPGLSGDGTVACATCHDPSRAFSDGKPVAETLGRGTRRTPSLVNVAYMRWLFWDGRADSLWAQAVEPIENPIEMGGDRVAVARHLREGRELRAAYEALFGALPELDDARRFPAHARPDPERPDAPHARAWSSMSEEDREAVEGVLANVGKAIAAYERRLVRGDAPFDRHVRSLREGAGEGSLEASARRGLALFLGRAGCAQCHSGPNFSDSEFHATGAPPGPFGDPEDAGRYAGAERWAASPWNAAGPHSDDRSGPAALRVSGLRRGSETWGEFRTPSLRNLAGRAPYMHAGQFLTLEDVVRFYSTLEGAVGRSHHQEQVLAPLHLEPAEVADLLAFLRSLEGAPLDPSLLQAPTSPLGED